MSSGHKVYQLDGEWVIQTGYTADFYGTLAVVKTLPGAKFVPGPKVWSFDPSGDKVLQAIEVLGLLEVLVPPALMIQAQALAADLDSGAEAADHRAEDTRLYPYQVEGIETLARSHNFLLADDMGLGKTVQALLSIPADAPVLCVVPANVKGNWENEIKFWRPDIERITILKGRKSFRFPEAGEVVIVNWAILPEAAVEVTSPPEAVKAHEEFKARVPSGLVVIGDEIHRAKNRKAQRTQRYAGLNALASAAQGRAWGLTGTPLLNRPPELWCLLETLGLGAKAFGSFGGFYKAFNAVKTDFGTEWGMPQADVPEKLAKVSLHRHKTQVLPDLPGKRWQTVNVDIKLSREERKALNELAKDIKSGKVKTLSNGLPRFEEMSEQRALLAKAKIPALLDLVESYEDTDTPVVVFSAHKAPINELSQREGWATITGDTSPEARTLIVADFQAGKYKGIGLTIKAGCEGITLTHASNMIFVDYEWVPALNTQAEDRICRIGQEDQSGCLYRVLVANHEIDELLQEKLTEKKALIAATIRTSTSKVANGVSKLLEGVKVAEKAVKVKTYTCPLCKATLLSKASAKNEGREYIACNCRYPSFFEWLDAERVNCWQCGSSCAVSTVKKEGKNKGKKFFSCHTHGFTWLDANQAPKPKMTRSQEIVYGERNYGDTGTNGDRQTVVTREFSEVEQRALAADLLQVLGNCDGAFLKDKVGFNAPDAPIARCYAAAIDEGEDVNWTGLHEMLTKYRGRQLAGEEGGE